MESLLNPSERHRPQTRLGTSPVTTTLRSLGRKQIEGLCGALGIAEQTDRALATFDIASNTWADRSLDRPAFKSDITDDSSPYEFSVAFDGRTPELRLLAEAQGNEGTALDRWNAGWRLTEQLAQHYGLSLARARRVAPLFEPKVQGLAFSLWHAASFRSAQPGFRVYFNPQAKGRSQAMPSVFTALKTLGMAGAAAWLKARFAQGEHKPLYFSVDLSDGPTARCKVYLAHPGANANRIESLIAGHGDHQPGDVGAFCRSMTGGEGSWTQRPPLTCLAFREGSDSPYTVTLHIPIRCYARNDEVALERISSELTVEEASAYGRAVRGLARRSLDSVAGIQTYASVRREDGRKRMTIYLSPEAYRAVPKSPVD
jgi:DMATS type aromatic prenyltransferase